MPDKTLLLAADMGATHSRFSIFTVMNSEDGPPKLSLLRSRKLFTTDYPGFSDLLQALQASGLFEGLSVRRASLAAAGPVAHGRCIPPNIPWHLEARTAETVLGLERCLLLNDFVAQGYACLMAEDAHGREILDIKPVKPGRMEKDFPAAIMGAGTGLGQAIVLPDVPRVLASEGGHGRFSFSDADELGFCAYLRKVRGRDDISPDMVLGGRGLSDLYNFIMGTHISAPGATARLNAEPARPGHDRVLAAYARFYGRAAQNFALTSLCRRGLYIAGGMALRVPVLHHPAFIAEFEHNSVQRALLKTIPIFHLESPDSGLWGAGLYGAIDGKIQ
ncbi:glucokinase [Desulfosarcina sp. OttesenSCG-928-A07]|nr:glucokinase [Desulfosarcina sp. OttesenSCG-928-G17]MDL2328437.1 glucokinase [Desulfosarcina sp. OttesenSCG-928-A07]